MPKRKNGPKFYAVAIGRTPGIYPTWAECQSNVKGYPNARFKKFSTEEEAQSFIDSVSKVVFRNNSSATTETQTTQKRRKVGNDKIPGDSTLGNANNPIAVESSDVAAPKNKNKQLRAVTASTSATHKTEAKDNGDAATNSSDEEYAAKQYPQKLMFHVMFDGGSRGNPHGHAGAGAYILKRSFCASENTSSAKKSPTEILRHTTRIRSYLGMGKLTNNQAEYMGLITGLENVSAALEKIGHPNGGCDILQDVNVLVQGDSDLIVKQLKGIYACKSANLKSYHQRAKNLVQKVRSKSKTMGATFDVTFEHVYRESNTIADGLANEAMDAQRSWATSQGEDRKQRHAKSKGKAAQKSNKPQSDEDAIEV